MDETTNEPPGDSPALVPMRQEIIDFYGDQIIATQTTDAQIYVPVRLLCDNLGMSWAGQRERIYRNPVLAQAAAVVRVTRSTATGGVPDMLCLPLDMIPGWLFGISADRVRPELREKIVRYQRECFRVLWNAFKGDILPTDPPGGGLTEAQRTLELITAMQRMAQQQVDLEQRVHTIAEYTRGFIQQTRSRLTDHDDRLTALELRLDPTAVISEEQAAELALAVKNVGQRLAGQGEKTGYARVYSEMYRRYRTSSYKSLPLGKYDEVMAWLHAWYEELGDAATGP